MISKIPDEVLKIITVLENAGHKAFIVGGCMRDLLLGFEPKDFDICTSAHPEQVLNLFSKSIPTGLKYGTVTVIVNDIPFEITTFRIESDYTDHRHPDNVKYSDSLAEDLNRRDFTINAIAFHPAKGIIDPFNGIKDLNNKIIRTVGNPKDRFKEDALRMLRAIRFQARFGFTIDSETFSAIELMSKNIRDISRERILDELNGILLAPFPEAFENLFKTGLYNNIFPVSFSVLSDLKPLRELSNELIARWSALLWLLGIRDIEDIRVICSILKMSNKLKGGILKTSKLLNASLPKNSFTLRKALATTGYDIFVHYLSIMKTLGNSKKNVIEIEETVKEIISKKNCINLSKMAVSGGDLIEAGFKQGKELGVILETLFICVLQKPELNRKDILISVANTINQYFQ